LEPRSTAKEHEEQKEKKGLTSLLIGVTIFISVTPGKTMTLTQLKYFLCGLLLVLFVGSGFAAEETRGNGQKEDKEDQYYHIREEVVVTATMSKAALKDIAFSVELVNTDDLKAIAGSSALNILHYYPGLFVRKSGDFGRADVDIRGLGQNGRRIAVLVNGRPEKMGLFGCAVTHAFPLDNVERIEVVKGPASVLYGGEALGGVVNLITHMPREGFETDIGASYGSFDTRQFNLKHGGSLDKFKYFLTYDQRQSDGHIENSAYSGRAATARIDYDLAAHWRLSVQGKYFSGKKYEPGTVDVSLKDFWNDYRRGAVDVALEKRGEGHEWLVRLYRNFGNHRFSDGWDSRDYTNGGLLRYTNRKITNNVLTVGGDFRSFGGKSYGFPQGQWDKSEASLFFHDQYVLGEKWILTSGLRLQFDSLYGRELAPHLGLVFQFSDKTSLRGVVNKGFRSPQLNELFMFPAANPGLEPERVWNYELGIEQLMGRRFTLRANVFRMRGTNMIETVSNPTAPPTFIFKNSGEFDFYGAELELQGDFGRLFSADLSYAFLDPGARTRGRPGQKMDLSLRFRTKILYAALQGQYVTDYFADDGSSNRLPSYFLLNGRVMFQIGRHVEMTVDINNIFAEEYLIFGEFPGLSAGAYRMPGRNIQVGVRLSQ
jgi:iron complex outermembrane receptor protein